MYTSSFRTKLWLSLCVGIVTAEVFRRLSFKYFSPPIPRIALLVLTLLLLLVSLILPFVWHRKEKQQSINSQKVKAYLEHILLYTLSVDLLMFGFHKIEGLQMIVPLGILDTPFSSFSGETLVWAFFRYSRSFVLFLAVLQVIPAILLLFSKTRLSGLILALPTLVFICSLDFFYNMPPGVLIHGLILLLGIAYFLSQDTKRLSDYLFQPMQGLGKLTVSTRYKTIAQVSVFMWPLVFHLIYEHPDKHPDLTGKYIVTDLKVNNAAAKAMSPKDSVLTNVYMDLADEIVFDFNDYRHRYIGKYYLDKTSDSVRIQWRYPSDKLEDFKGKLIKNNEILILDGKMNGETLEMSLEKR